MDSFLGLFVQTHAEGALNLDLVRLAVRTHHQPQNHRALVLRLASFFGVLGSGA